MNLWLNVEIIKVNTYKFNHVVFFYRKKILLPTTKIGRDHSSNWKKKTKFSDITLDSSLSFNELIYEFYTKFSRSVGTLNKLKQFLPEKSQKTYIILYSIDTLNIIKKQGSEHLNIW